MMEDDMDAWGGSWDLDRHLEQLARHMAEKRRGRETEAREAHRRGEIMHVTLPGPGRQWEIWLLPITPGQFAG